MRWVLLFGLSLLIFPCNAAEVNEQKITTPDQSCAIHYFSDKSKKLWSIDVSQSYCETGWVQGLATVQLKDSLNRPAQALKGFFHQGYWLSSFLEPIQEFWRESSQDETQDFIYQIAQNKELDITYYTVARSYSQSGNYGAFELCPTQPILLAQHPTETDFKQSLFQSYLLKDAKDIMTKRCPNISSFQIIGITTATPSLKEWRFRATIDIPNSETTLFYRDIPVIGNIPRPSELRRELGEKLLTIKPPKTIDKTLNSPSKKEPQQKQSEPSADLSPTSNIQSAIDLALLANVLQSDVQGTAAVYIESSELTSSIQTTKPLKLSLQTQQPLTTGWYLIDGVFHHQPTGVVHILSATPCKKEWCLNEN